MKNFSARWHLPPQQPCLPGQDNGSDDDHADDNDDNDDDDNGNDNEDDDDDDNDDDDDGNQVDGAQKQLVGSLGAIERMLGIITEKLQVAILLFTHTTSVKPYTFLS